MRINENYEDFYEEEEKKNIFYYYALAMYNMMHH